MAKKFQLTPLTPHAVEIRRAILGAPADSSAGGNLDPKEQGRRDRAQQQWRPVAEAFEVQQRNNDQLRDELVRLSEIEPTVVVPPPPDPGGGPIGEEEIQVSYDTLTGTVFYPDSVPRILNSKLGERFSVLDIAPTAGNGELNEAPLFEDAYLSKIAKGGGQVHVPGVVGAGYRFNEPLILTNTTPIEFIGEGRASKIFRGANMPAGKGVIDLTGAKHITFRRLFFDGAVTTSAKLDYSAFGSDPAHALLTANSMFWLHGAEDITFIDCDFEHTGGYSHYLDARAAKVKGIRFVNCRWRNNRPHTIGTGADLNFGSPTGGIFYQNQGTGATQNRVEDLTVRGCKFARGTGRGVWGHGYGFDTLHTRIHVDHNIFEDYGLNGVIPGNTMGGSVIANSFRRVGYVCSDDTAPSVPKWHPGNKPAAIGGYGITKLVPYTANEFVSINGAAIDGDGYSYGTISDNVIRVPRSGDAEYAEDSIASLGAAQGIILKNDANRAEGASVVTISGNTCDNLSGTAIGLYASRRCYAYGNLLIVPTQPAGAPIAIGGLGAGANQNATDNFITGNTIHYSPADSRPAVIEDPQFRAFVPTDKNSVVGNRILGVNAFEFQRDPISDSNTALFFTTNTAATSQSRHGLQREGFGEGSALRWYAQDGDPFGWLHMQLQMYRNPGARGPLLNISETGPGPPEMINEGGVITTGPHTTSPYGHAMTTGKLHATAFMAFNDFSFWDAEADMLPATWALLRWDNAAGKWRQSVATTLPTGGARIWTDFAAGGTATNPAGLNGEIQFNRNGVFGASAYLTWSEGSGVTPKLNVTTDPNNPAIHIYNGYLLSREGIGFAMIAEPWVAEANQVRMYADLAGTIYVSRNLGAYVPFGNPAGLDSQIQWNNNGAFGASPYLTWTNVGAQKLNVSGDPNTPAIQIYNGFLRTKEGLCFEQIAPAAGVPAVSETGQVRIYADIDGLMYISTNTEPYGPFSLTPAGSHMWVQWNDNGVFGASEHFYYDNSIQTMTIDGGVALETLTFTQLFAAQEPPLAPSGKVRLYANRDGQMYISTSMQAYGPFSLTPGGSDKYVQYNKNGVFEGDAALMWHYASQFLDVGGPVRMDNLIFYQYAGVDAPDVSGPGQVRIYANTNGLLYISTNTAPYGPLSVHPGGSNMQIQFNENGVFGASPNLAWNNGDGTAGLLGLNGYLQTQAINNSVQWVMYRTFAPTHVYYMGIDGGENWFLMDASRGGYQSLLVTPVPLVTAGPPAVYKPEEVIVATCGWFRGSGGLGFMQMGAEPARSIGGQVRIYANTNGSLYISTNGAAYGPFATGGTTLPAGPDTSVQYNVGGTSFGGSLDLKWEAAGKTLNIGGGSNDTACRIQTNSTGIPNVQLGPPFAPNNIVGDVHWMMHRPWVYIWYMGITPNGTWFLRDPMHASTGLPNGPDVLTVRGGDTAGAGAVVYTPGWFQSIQGFLATGTAYSAVDARNGGALVQTLSFARVNTGVTAAPPVSGSSGNGEVKLYANTNGQLYISTNGAAWGPFGGGGSGTPGGANTEIQFNKAGAFGGDGDLTWDAGAVGGTGGTLDVWSKIRVTVANGNAWQISSQSSQFTPNLRQFYIRDETNNVTCFQIVPNIASLVMVYTSGYFESGNGFNAAGNAFNAIRSTGGGGVSVAYLRASYCTHIGQSAGIPGLQAGDTASDGQMWYDTQTSSVRVRIAGNIRTVSTF